MIKCVIKIVVVGGVCFSLTVSYYYLSNSLKVYIVAREEYTEIEKKYFELESEKEISVDEQMRLLNKDYIAWITIPEAEISYPIVRETGASYLSTDFNGNESIFGTLFIRGVQDPFVDKNTIIFGHNMKDGSMFGNLKSYLKKTFAEENLITITQNGVDIFYKVFAVQIVNENDDTPYSYTFRNEEEYMDYVKMMLRTSVVTLGVDSKEIGDMLTLSTCYGKSDRLLIQAYKIGEKP